MINRAQNYHEGDWKVVEIVLALLYPEATGKRKGLPLLERARTLLVHFRPGAATRTAMVEHASIIEHRSSGALNLLCLR